jgi:uncharacterized protein (UPF0303 family)
MTAAQDIAKIAEQEKTLVFPRFDEATAFEIGSALRKRALAEKLPIVIEIRTWDRLLFYAALPGSTASNGEWVRRKFNVVQMFRRSTYGMVLERKSPDKTFPVGWGLDIADYVLAGGCFPVHVEGAGVIGGIGVSGLPDRQDHNLVVAVLCDHLGIPAKKLALGEEAPA